MQVADEVKVEEEEFNESDWEEVGSDEEETADDPIVTERIPVDECLFCGHLSEDMAASLKHMSLEHTFFVPDIEYCVDLKGLLRYLGIKIASGRCCLFCSEFGKQFASKRAAQQHMLDKGHTKIKFNYSDETILEFEDFYDYSSSYQTNGEDGEASQSNELAVNETILDDDDYQLKLPSGAVIGHRSLFVYYKQSLKPARANDHNYSKNKELTTNVVSQYKSLGWTGLTSSMAVRVAKDLQYMNRIRNKHWMRLGAHQNKTSQPHFRHQVLQ